MEDPVASESASRKSEPRSAFSRHTVLMGLERSGLPLLLVVLFVFFAVNPTSGEIFIGSANIKNILANQAVVGLVALAMVIPLVSGYFDLSVAATAGAANVALASTIGPHGWPLALGILFAILLGAFIGLLIGFLVAKLGLNAFVVTLGAYTLIGGLAQLYTQGAAIREGIPPSFSEWGSETWLSIPKPFYLLIVVAAISWYLLANTPFGRYLEGIGSNEPAARLVGINVTRTVWASFVISGVLAAVAGVLQTSRSGVGSDEVGSAILFPALTAVFLGATTIRPGQYNVWGTVIGVYFVAVSVSGLTLLGAETWVQPVFNGGALIIAVALTTFLARARERSGTGRVETVQTGDEEPGGGGANDTGTPSREQPAPSPRS
jgi:ribose transport system permease protein